MTLIKGAHGLILAIAEWLRRKQWEINDLTQLLIGHGRHRVYLYTFKLDTLPDFPNYDGVPEDSVGVFFQSPSFLEERRKLEETLGEIL